MRVKLKDIASFAKGQQINGDDLDPNGQYDFLNGGIAPSGRWTDFNVEGGTVAISEGGNSCGYVNYMESPFWCGAHCYYLFDLQCEAKYLFYALKSQEDRLMALRSGACMPNIRKNSLTDFEFYFDNEISAQKNVIQTLDKVSNLIALRKQQLDKLDELVKSRFVEMFGDPETNPKRYEKRKLASLTRKISDGVHAKPEYTKIGRPFLSVVNINKGVINFDGCKFVSEEAYQKMIKSTCPERGDVLYTKVGATYGIPAYVDTDTKFCLYVSVSLIKPKHDEINSKFLALSMGMPYVKRQADSRIKGIGVPDLHLNQISEFDILCPSREEQEVFISFVEQSDKCKLTIQRGLDKLETMKKALMQQYFGFKERDK